MNTEFVITIRHGRIVMDGHFHGDKGYLPTTEELTEIIKYCTELRDRRGWNRHANCWNKLAQDFNDLRGKVHRDYIFVDEIPCRCEECKRLMQSIRAELSTPRDNPLTEPKPTYIYVGTNRHGEYKIGRSVNPQMREKTLQSDDPQYTMLFHFKGYANDELVLHDRYADKRIRGEWFRLSESDVAEIRMYAEAGE